MANSENPEEMSPMEKMSVLSTENRTSQIFKELKEFVLSSSNVDIFIARISQAYFNLSVSVHEFNTDVENEFKIMPDYKTVSLEEKKRKVAELWKITRIEWHDKMNNLMRNVSKSLVTNSLLIEILYIAFEKLSKLSKGIQPTSIELREVQISAAKARRQEVLDQWADKRGMNMSEAQKYAEKGEKILLEVGNIQHNSTEDRDVNQETVG